MIFHFNTAAKSLAKVGYMGLNKTEESLRYMPSTGGERVSYGIALVVEEILTCVDGHLQLSRYHWGISAEFSRPT